MEQKANNSHRLQFDLAAAAYGTRPLPPGYKVAQHYVDPVTGFKGAAIDGPNGERHYVIAGTEDGRDALADVNLGKRQYGSEAAQKMRENAAEYARNGKKVSFTGHSLGGGLAQAMAYDVGKASGKPEVVSSTSFNSFGGKELIERTRTGGEKYDPAHAAKLDAVNYRMADDKVSRIGTHIGAVKAMSGPAVVNGENVDDLPVSPARDIQSHGLDALARAIAGGGLEKAYPDKPVPWQEINAGSAAFGDAADGVHRNLYDPLPPIDEDQDPEASLQNAPDVPPRHPDPGKLPGGAPRIGAEDAHRQQMSLADFLKAKTDDIEANGSGLGKGVQIASAGEVGGLAAEARATAEQEQSATTRDPRAAAIAERAAAPLANPGEAALVKPVEAWTEGEMKDVLGHAQAGFRGWRSGDTQKALAYEKVQDWHTHVYGDDEQTYDGGKPVEPVARVVLPEQPTPPRTPQGEDLYQASGRIGQRVADAAGLDGVVDAVKGLQRGLNMLGRQPMPKRSEAWGPYTRQAPLLEDGQYGPRTDFALKNAVGRVGAPKVENALALGRFNTFARNARKTGNVDGLEKQTHAIFGPLFRDPADTRAPKVEAGVLQETLNGLGADLKVDHWIGPKTTAAFGRVLQDEDADSFTSAFGKGLGLA